MLLFGPVFEFHGLQKAASESLRCLHSPLKPQNAIHEPFWRQKVWFGVVSEDNLHRARAVRVSMGKGQGLGRCNDSWLGTRNLQEIIEIASIACRLDNESAYWHWGIKDETTKSKRSTWEDGMQSLQVEAHRIREKQLHEGRRGLLGAWEIQAVSSLLRSVWGRRARNTTGSTEKHTRPPNVSQVTVDRTVFKRKWGGRFYHCQGAAFG